MSKKFWVWLLRFSLAVILSVIARRIFAYAGYPLPDEMGREYYFGIAVGFIFHVMFSGDDK